MKALFFCNTAFYNVSSLSSFLQKVGSSLGFQPLRIFNVAIFKEDDGYTTVRNLERRFHLSSSSNFYVLAHSKVVTTTYYFYNSSTVVLLVPVVASIHNSLSRMMVRAQYRLCTCIFIKENEELNEVSFFSKLRTKRTPTSRRLPPTILNTAKYRCAVYNHKE